MAVPLALKSFALASAALVLLVPTFNALNVAEFADSAPPWEMEPPEDFEPPEDVEGELQEGDADVEVTPPPGAPEGCDAVTTRTHAGDPARFGGSLGPLGPEQSGDVRVDVPPNAATLHLVVRFEQWYGELDVGPFLANGNEAHGTVSYEGAVTGSPRSGEETVELSVRPGEWTAAWTAENLAGGGGLAFVYTTVECAEPEEA